MTAEEKKMLEEVHQALIGNKELGELGIAKKVDMMWTVFAGLTLFGKAAAWLAVVLAGAGAAWEAMIHFLRTPIK
jgi:hypothetical protein